MKKAIVLVLVLTMMMTLFAGCSNTKQQSGNNGEASTTQPATQVTETVTEPETVKEAEAKRLTIGFANVNDIYPYLVKVRSFVEKFAKEADFDVVVANAAGDINTQIGQIETFITQGVDIVISVPADPEGIVPTADLLWGQGIPFLTVCGNSTGKEIHVGSLNYDAGVMQAEYLAEALPENAKVLYMHADPNQEMNDRRDGFMTLFDKRPDLELLSEQNSQNRTDLGMNITEAWVQTYDQFDAIVCQNDDSALGAIEALKAANRLEGIIVVGLDGSDEALESIRSGELGATAFQDAEGQARALVEIAKQIRNGVDPDTIEGVHIPFRIITIANVNDVS